MICYFGSRLSENMSQTPEGYLICQNVPIARTGEQVYLARELGLADGDPERQVTVWREEREVFDAAAMASFEGKDVTDGHPAEGVDASNFSNYSKGHLQNVRRSGDVLEADLIIKDPVLASEVKNRVKREVSCGYLCEYVPDGNGYRQTHIRGNHVAVVPRGRAGHEIAIKDSAPEAQKGAHKMSATKALLEFFGLAAKDASPEELEVLTQNTAIVLDADPAKKAQEAEPTEAPAAEDEAPAKDGADPLAKIMERLTALERVVNKDKEETANDETVIDKALERLKGEDGASEVVEEKTAGAGEKKAVSADAAAAILTAMRPVVAAIEDREVRRSVADALVESVRGSSPVEDIQKAAAASAQKAADEAVKTGYQKICEGQQSAYNARNPHVKKRED